MRRRTVLIFSACLAVLSLTACLPPAPPASYPEVEAFIHEVFDPLGQGDEAVRVAQCESGLNPHAGAGRYYQGVFQLGRHIVAINQYGGDYLDYRQNVQAARDLYVTRGNWSAWTCQP